jgi:hypothetical protein
LTILTNTF